jgi:hypothetical protein
MAEVILDLGKGLELWRVEVDELREQDFNAQVMPKAMFDRLAKTIQADGRLESLPLCARVGDDIEIVSGHHRVRAARSAGLSEIFAIVDVSGLDRDAVAAKQLAHNAIHGHSEPQLLKKIYESIKDVNRRLESFIDPAKLNLKVEKVQVGNLDLGLDYRTALLVFLPYEKERFDKACEAVQTQLTGELAGLYMAELKFLDQWKALLKKVGKEYDVRATGTVLSKIADLVLQALGEPADDGEEHVALRDVFGTSTIPKEVAEKLTQVVDRLIDEGAVPKQKRWRALDIMATANAVPL